MASRRRREEGVAFWLIIGQTCSTILNILSGICRKTQGVLVVQPGWHKGPSNKLGSSNDSEDVIIFRPFAFFYIQYINALGYIEAVQVKGPCPVVQEPLLGSSLKPSDWDLKLPGMSVIPESFCYSVAPVRNS